MMANRRPPERGTKRARRRLRLMRSAQDMPLDRDGIVRPEFGRADDPTCDTPDLDGIEIDNAIERPQEGQPRQPGGSV